MIDKIQNNHLINTPPWASVFGTSAQITTSCRSSSRSPVELARSGSVFIFGGDLFFYFKRVKAQNFADMVANLDL